MLQFAASELCTTEHSQCALARNRDGSVHKARYRTKVEKEAAVKAKS